MNENKEKRLTIRLTPEQYESLSARASTAQMPLSAYVRAAAMRHKIVVVEGLKEITHELKGIGRNLNQLTILANEGRISSLNLSDIIRLLDGIYTRLDALAGREKR